MKLRQPKLGPIVGHVTSNSARVRMHGSCESAMGSVGVAGLCRNSLGSRSGPEGPIGNHPHELSQPGSAPKPNSRLVLREDLACTKESGSLRVKELKR